MPVDFSLGTGDWEAVVMAKLRAMPVAVGLGLENASKMIKVQVEGSTPVSDRKTHGTLQSGWGDIVYGTLFSFSFSNTVPYASILEEGRYPNAGPRTSSGSRADGMAGIFSNQAPGGMITPWAYDRDKIEKIVDFVIEALERHVGATSARA